MTTSRVMRALRALACGTATLFAATNVVAQLGAPNGEWRTYGGDLGHTRYAALDQIDASNFNRLEVAWRFKTDNLGPAAGIQLSVDAADGRRRRVLHGGHETVGRCARRSERGAALGAPTR